MDAAIALKDNLLAFANARLTTVDPVAVLSTVLIVMGVYLVMFVAAADSPWRAPCSSRRTSTRVPSRT